MPVTQITEKTVTKHVDEGKQRMRASRGRCPRKRGERTGSGAYAADSDEIPVFVRQDPSESGSDSRLTGRGLTEGDRNDRHDRTTGAFFDGM